MPAENVFIAFQNATYSIRLLSFLCLYILDVTMCYQQADNFNRFCNCYIVGAISDDFEWLWRWGRTVHPWL